MKPRNSYCDGADSVPVEKAIRRHSHTGAIVYDDRMVPSRRSTETNLKRNSTLARASPKFKSDPYERYLSLEMLPQHKNSSQQNICKVLARRSIPVPHKGPDIKPYRTIKVDGWTNEFYSNLLDWSYNNYIGVASGSCVDVVNPYSDGSQIRKSITSISYSFIHDVSSIAFSPQSTKYVTGLSNGQLHVVDYVKNKEVIASNISLHRVSAIEWKKLIFCGGRNCEVYAFDIRSPLCAAVLHSGKSEVCGIKQFDNLVAVGTNSNSVTIYDIRKGRQVDKYHHAACVKALCWDRSGQHLYSGGGCTDRRIFKWSAKQTAVVAGVTTDSQICNLVHSKSSNDITACFGYPLNEISVWNSRLTKTSTFRNNKKGRVLYAVLNQPGDKLVTGNGRGDIQFWRPFDCPGDGLSPTDCR